MRLNHKKPDAKKLKEDEIISAWGGLSLSEIDTWVEENVTSLEDVRSVLKRLIKLKMKGNG